MQTGGNIETGVSGALEDFKHWGLSTALKSFGVSLNNSTFLIKRLFIIFYCQINIIIDI